MSLKSLVDEFVHKRLSDPLRHDRALVDEIAALHDRIYGAERSFWESKAVTDLSAAWIED